MTKQSDHYNKTLKVEEIVLASPEEMAPLEEKAKTYLFKRFESSEAIDLALALGLT